MKKAKTFRPTAFAFHFDNDVNSHSYYPYSDAPVQDGITFENVRTSSLSAAEERPALVADDVTGIVQTASPSLSIRNK